ncbi:hypothetical protein B0H13DRAFT_2067115 [Mycena leptocephala]|nr:hypothetical protein B0H13DRAFT_2067115 [Mycena leptocephala]
MSVNELKDQGNKAFDAGDYDKAIDLYMQAITLHPQNYVSFSDRSAAYARKNQWAEALTDAEQVRCAWDGPTSRLTSFLSALH